MTPREQAISHIQDARTALEAASEIATSEGWTDIDVPLTEQAYDLEVIERRVEKISE